MVEPGGTAGGGTAAAATANPLFSTPVANTREDAEGQKEGRTLRLSSSVSDFTPRRSLSAVVTENFAYSVRGIENFHIYMWILKDFSWAQDDYWMAVVMGSAALFYCGLLLYMALPDVEEVYMYIALTGWLFGNYWWMSGEVGISGDDDTNAPQAAHILMATISWLGLYYLLLRPMGWIAPSQKTLQRYKLSGLKPRFSCFPTWRAYEYIHAGLWMLKDLSWCLLEPVPWVIFSVPTVLISIDFVWVTWKQGHVVDSAHYCAQLLWVISNLTWAGGELFSPQYDDPIPITTRSPTAYKTCRWWASILLVCAFVPITVLYFIYFPIMTCVDSPAMRGRGGRTYSVNNNTTNSDDELLPDGDKSPEPSPRGGGSGSSLSDRGEGSVSPTTTGKSTQPAVARASRTASFSGSATAAGSRV